jgi:predicted GNAT family N-acyltransferase
MNFCEIEFGSDDFRKECELRHEVLRVPIGLSLYDEDLDRERPQQHFGLFDQRGDLVACVVAIALSPSQAKIRQMAVHGKYQGKGYGRRTIHDLEDYLARQEVVHLTLNSRLTAVGFYLKLGYTKVGQEFVEVGISHIKMEKYIQRISKSDVDESTCR